MTTRRVLVTGGAGFIGSHLVEALLARGDHVTVIDDLSTGRWANLEHVAGDPRLRVIVASAAERDLLEREVPGHDLVYHLASAVGVRLVVDQPVRTVETIFLATHVVLAAAARYRRPVVLTSTSEVYGNSPRVPFREDDDVVMGPTEKRRWAYACAKALDEFLALAHFTETRLPVYVVRLFNTVGPRQSPHYGMVLPSFVRRALEGRPLEVYGTGEQRRCFCHVADVVRGLLRLPEVEAARGKVINLGSQEEVTIRGLAERVLAVTGSASPIELVSYEAAYGQGFDDMQRRVPDLSRAEALLGWAPRARLDDTIRAVVESWRAEQAGA